MKNSHSGYSEARTWKIILWMSSCQSVRSIFIFFVHKWRFWPRALEVRVTQVIRNDPPETVNIQSKFNDNLFFFFCFFSWGCLCSCPKRDRRSKQLTVTSVGPSASRAAKTWWNGKNRNTEKKGEMNKWWREGVGKGSIACFFSVCTSSYLNIKSKPVFKCVLCCMAS